MAPSEYAYPSDLDSDDGSIIWDQDDDNNEIDTLASSLYEINLGDSNSSIPALCIVCKRRPPHRSYSGVCGLVCSAALQNAQRNARRDSQSYIPVNSGTTGRSALNRNNRGITSRRTNDRRNQTGPQCVICHRRPAFEGKVTCGLKCAEKLALEGGDPAMCNYCHRRKRNGNHLQCGQTCADRAKVACLFCRCQPRNGRYHLCGKTCRKLSVKHTPLLLEAPRGHSTFDMVEKKFKSSWKGGSTCPEVKRVFKIIESDEFLRPYNAYRKRVKNEHFRYHGTTRGCSLGKETSGKVETKVCNSSSCSICSILKTSFKVSLANPSGSFGAGVYTSSASSMSFGYCRGGDAMLLTKVVLGNIKTVSAGNWATSCPAGYNSVVYDYGGASNETIVYSDDAIRPVFLITFS